MKDTLYRETITEKNYYVLGNSKLGNSGIPEPIVVALRQPKSKDHNVLEIRSRRLGQPRFQVTKRSINELITILKEVKKEL